ncbi:hypothetical protein V8C40DRAFT_268930 [Trichoderma camerunense]
MDNTLTASDRSILADVTSFIHQGTYSQKIELCRFLREQLRHVVLADLITIQELPLRIELIIKFHNLLKAGFASEKEYDFTNLQIAIFLLMPVKTLQSLHPYTSTIANSLTLQRLVPSLVHGVFPDGSSIYPSRVAITSKSICQNDQEREKCLLRDQRVCVLTKATGANPCHIAPVGLTTNQANMYTFTDSIFMNKLMGDIGIQISRIMVTDSLGAFEKSWNMLCLHPTLCKWWSECLFGLKCLEVAPSDDLRTVVRIQFNWMPRNEVKPYDLARGYQRTLDAMMQTAITDEQRNFFYYLKSGDSFEILFDSKVEALKMKAALDFQWVAVRLAAMSGISKEWKWESDDDD